MTDRNARSCHVIQRAASMMTSEDAVPRRPDSTPDNVTLGATQAQSKELFDVCCAKFRVVVGGEGAGGAPCMSETYSMLTPRDVSDAGDAA